MKSILIRKEDGLIDVTWNAGGVHGIPHFFGENQDTFLISISDLKACGASAHLEEGGLYSMQKICNNVELMFSIFRVAKKLGARGDRDYFLIEMGEYDEFKSALLDAWIDGIFVSWADLGVQYGDAWIALCRGLTAGNNFVQLRASETPIMLDAKNLRSEQDLYCQIGESIFGYRGYAGTNFDALYDVLNQNRLKCEIAFNDEAAFSKFCVSVTGEADYFEKLIKVFLDAGLKVRR